MYMITEMSLCQPRVTFQRWHPVTFQSIHQCQSREALFQEHERKWRLTNPANMLLQHHIFVKRKIIIAFPLAMRMNLLNLNFCFYFLSSKLNVFNLTSCNIVCSEVAVIVFE